MSAPAGVPYAASPGPGPLARVLLARRARTAALVVGVFFTGMFVDYGGGFKLKYLGILTAFIWVVLHRSSYRILRERWRDLLVLLGLPALLAAIHLGLAVFSAQPFDAARFVIRSYNTVSSAALILLLPLFVRAGSETLLRQLRRGFMGVCVLLLVMFALQSTGLVNWSEYSSFFGSYGIGAVGEDARIQDAATTERGQYSLRIAFSLPIILGAELGASLVRAGIMFFSLLVAGSRGLTAAALLVFIGCLVLAGRRVRGKTIARLGGTLMLAAVVIAAVPQLRFRFVSVFLERTAQIGTGTDYTTLARLGHLAGYWNMVVADPWKLLLGAGPAGVIVNPLYAVLYTDGVVDTTEFSLLNQALYYGVPYAVLYALWLLHGASNLWGLRDRAEFRSTDLGLVVGVVMFYVNGNINPQMMAPFAIIAYMLLVVRSAELEGHRWPA